MLVADGEMLHVTSCPRGQLLIRAKLLALLAPLEDGGVGLLGRGVAVVGHCKEKLKME